MVDKGNLIDEEVVLLMDISVKTYRYDSFTLFPGCIAKCTGSVKFSCQRIINGKIGETFQFNGKVIRHLGKMLGTDAVSGHNLAEELSDLPVLKPSKNKVKNPPAKPASSKLPIRLELRPSPHADVTGLMQQLVQPSLSNAVLTVDYVKSAKETLMISMKMHKKSEVLFEANKRAVSP